jgi:tetratricopeptide (TPR) repeat protein
MSTTTSPLHCRSRRGSISIFWVLSFLVILLQPSLALAQEAQPVPDASSNGKGRIECTECPIYSSEITQQLQKADAHYASFKTKEALDELLKILDLDPDNSEALTKAARAFIDLGDKIPESTPDRNEKKIEQYLIAEQFARRAIEVDPAGTWGHFFVAASLGKISFISSVSEKIDLAQEIRDEADKAIALDPDNGFAYHVLGVWHRTVAEIGKMSRIMVQTILWRTIPKGSFEKSKEYLKKAVSLNPDAINHHLELAKTYIAMSKWDLARQHLKIAEDLPIQYSDDKNHKENARHLLQEIKDR